MSAGKKDQSRIVPRHEERVVLETDTHRITAGMSVREIPFPNMEGPTYSIKYRGKDNEITEREIIIQWINVGKSSAWATAYCKLRREVRKFNSDQIVSMTDVRTGKIVSDPTAHLRWLDKNGF